jgi:hypothetical protein
VTARRSRTLGAFSGKVETGFPSGNAANARSWGTFSSLKPNVLGCHDFHGNHKRVAQTRLEDAHAISAIVDYLNGGPSPYGQDLKYPTKTGGR